MSDLKGIEYKRFENIKHIREDGSEYWSARDVGRILRTFKIKKNVEVTDNGKIII